MKLKLSVPVEWFFAVTGKLATYISQIGEKEVSNKNREKTKPSDDEMNSAEETFDNRFFRGWSHQLKSFSLVHTPSKTRKGCFWVGRLNFWQFRQKVKESLDTSVVKSPKNISISGGAGTRNCCIHEV